MNRKALMILTALTCLGSSAQAGMIENWRTYFSSHELVEPPTLKLLIAHDQPGVLLEVKGKYQIYDPHQNKYLSTRFIGKRKFIQALQDGLKWGEEFPGLHQLKIVPDNDRVTTLVDGVEYKGNVYIYDIGGTISVVNEVDVEDYLKSVLASQFQNNLPDELLAAIAITARTHAYYLMQNPRTHFWDIEASKTGYEGNAAITHGTGIIQGIDTTRYMTMLKNGMPFSAEWGSPTGGIAKDNKSVFSKITLFDAEELAKNGKDATQILSKAYPGEVLELMYRDR